MRLGQDFPDTNTVGLLLRKHDQTVVILGLLDHHLDLLAGFDVRDALGVGEFVGRDQTFGLVADVDENVVGIGSENGSNDDFTLFDEIDALLEELGKVLGFGLRFLGHIPFRCSCWMGVLSIEFFHGALSNRQCRL